jgi:hypothetical protein
MINIHELKFITETHMTQLQLEMSRAAYKVAFIFEAVANFFKKIFKAVHDARQDKANRIIADYMKHEYPHETYGYVLRMIEEGTIDEVRK